MKPFYRHLVMATIVLSAGLFLTDQYLDAKLEEQRLKGKAVELAAAEQHEWNADNPGRIRLRARILSILSEFKNTLHHEPVLLADLIIAKAEEYRLDPYLILGVIKTESDFRRYAVSPKGAVGLMQLRPHTAGHILGTSLDGEERNLYDNELNISLGAQYLAQLIRRFGNVELALEAYNRGPTRLRQSLDEGDEVERDYAAKVLGNYHRLRAAAPATSL